MIVYNSVIPFKGFLCINLFGILFVRKEYKDKLSQIDINHEMIHTEQIKELFFIGFYIIYFLEWLVRLIQHGNCKRAYRDISFEKEAYSNEKNQSYNRKPFAWLAYL